MRNFHRQAMQNALQCKRRLLAMENDLKTAGRDFAEAEALRAGDHQRAGRV
jgi:hypothetical protein